MLNPLIIKLRKIVQFLRVKLIEPINQYCLIVQSLNILIGMIHLNNILNNFQSKRIILVAGSQLFDLQNVVNIETINLSILQHTHYLINKIDINFITESEHQKEMSKNNLYDNPKNKDTQISQTQGLRAAFKQSLSKLVNISTRQPAMREVHNLILRHKTTNNLRIWLSVLSQNRNRHTESQLLVLWFIIKNYCSGLLDPLDKVPSLQKTVFRITELLIRFFSEQSQNVALACQKAYLQLYVTTLKNQQTEVKKKLLFTNLQAIINGGAGKVTQVTAQIVIDGLLETSLSIQDHFFFKQIAKRCLVLFLKTTINHPCSLTTLQTILSYFSINNLLPLLQSIVNKILSYINSSQANSIGYKIKAQCCNALDLIGNQIDRNGLPIYDKIIRVIQDLATDKVWAVQVTGRKAVSTWRHKKKQWDQQFVQKNQKFADQIDQQGNEHQMYQNQKIMNVPKTYNNFYQPRNQQPKARSKSPQYKTAENWNPKQENQRIRNQFDENTRKIFGAPGSNIPVTTYQSNNLLSSDGLGINPSKYLHKNTGIGGGNNVQYVEQYQQEKARMIQHPETYSRKMGELKKSIFNDNTIELQDTVPWEQSKALPSMKQSSPKKNQIKAQKIEVTNQNIDTDLLQKWQKIVSLADSDKFEQAVKMLIEVDDDIYFLRFMLKYSQNDILECLTRQTSNKLLKKMLQIKSTNFLQQMLFMMVSQTIKSGAGKILTNGQNMQIIKSLENCQQIDSLSEAAQRMQTIYQNFLKE